jgi:hypothetical protein
MLQKVPKEKKNSICLSIISAYKKFKKLIIKINFNVLFIKNTFFKCNFKNVNNNDG